MTPQDPLRREPTCVMCSDEHRAGPCFGPGRCFAGKIREPYAGWDPDPLTLDEPEPPKPVRATGCTPIAVLALLLALSGVPGVVAGPAPSDAVQPRVTLAAVSPLTVERHRGASVGPSGLMSGHPPGGAGADLASAVGETAGAPPTSEVGTAIYTASATWCAPTPDKCTDWGGNARLAAVNRFTWGDEPYPVRVWRGDMYVDVTVVSHCGCFGEDGYIDLSPAAFELLAPLGIGRIDVEVEVLTDLRPHPDDQRMRLEDGGPIQLPATSTVDAP